MYYSNLGIYLEACCEKFELASTGGTKETLSLKLGLFSLQGSNVNISIISTSNDNKDILTGQLWRNLDGNKKKEDEYEIHSLYSLY